MPARLYVILGLLSLLSGYASRARHMVGPPKGAGAKFAPGAI